MTHLADLLPQLVRTNPGGPRITWYVLDGGPEHGERVELSAAVLANWVSKAANLLQDELDAAPGTEVVLDLPPHWRSLYWAAAAWAVGAHVSTGGDGDVVVTTDPATAPDGEHVVVVSPPALARQATVALPTGAVDEARELSTFGDTFVAYDRADGADTALDDPLLTYDLGTEGDGERVLLTVAAGDPLGPWLARATRTLVDGGSLVVVRTGPNGLDDDRLQALMGQERVTSH